MCSFIVLITVTTAAVLKTEANPIFGAITRILKKKVTLVELAMKKNNVPIVAQMSIMIMSIMTLSIMTLSIMTAH